MGMLGLHIAINDTELAQLRDVPDAELADFIGNVFEEEKFGGSDCCETDRSWAYIHSALNGTDPDGPLQFGQTPTVESAAKYAILGKQSLLSSDDYYIGFVSKEHVDGIATALSAITVEEIGDLVRQVHRKYNASGAPDDAADYAMGWYPGLATFYRYAADSGKNILFTVSF